jgi:hypothetical protein
MTEEQKQTITKRELVKAVRSWGRHDMDPSVCRGCVQPHHWTICIEDLLSGLGFHKEAEHVFDVYLKKNPEGAGNEDSVK